MAANASFGRIRTPVFVGFLQALSEDLVAPAPNADRNSMVC